MILRSAAFTVLFVASGVWAAKPPLYRLWVANPSGKITEVLADLLSRKLAGVDIAVVSHSERYKAAPHFPVRICAAEEYYLLGPGGELLGLGCIDRQFPTLSIPEISKTITKYKNNIGEGKNPTILARDGQVNF